MAEKEFNFEKESDITFKSEGMNELKIGDFDSKWLRHPKVGESIVLDIQRMYKDTNVTGTTKEGKSFKTSLSSVDFKYTIETKDGKLYSVRAWEVFGKLKELIQAQKRIDIKVKITHIKDGQKDKNSKDGNYSVELVK